MLALPLGNPGEQEGVTARSDFIPSFTGRLGYALDTWLFYAKGGYARIGDSYSVVGTFTGTAFNSSTTNNISVGTAASGAQIVAANAIGAVGINSQTIVPAQAGPLATDTPIWITGTFAAAAPTAGAAVFVLEWFNPGAL